MLSGAPNSIFCRPEDDQCRSVTYVAVGDAIDEQVIVQR